MAPAEPCPACADRGWTLVDCRIQPCDCGVYDPPKWVTRGDTPCLIPHWKDPDRPRRASVGYACAGHRDRIEQMLAELPALHDDLGAALTSSERQDSGQRKGHSTSTGISLNEKILDARQEIHNEAVRLARWVSEQTGEDLPTIDDMATIATWLVGQVDWICSDLTVDEEYANLSRLSRDCWRLAYPNGRRKVEVGPCGQDDCPGTLWLYGDNDDTRTMGCDDCKRTVEPRYWRRERRRIDGVDVNPWLLLADAAVQYGTTTRTVERWVAKGRLKSRGSPMRVKASAVEALMQAFSRSA